MKSMVVAAVLTVAMGAVVVLAGRDIPVVPHEMIHLADMAVPPAGGDADSVHPADTAGPVHPAPETR